MVIRHETAVFLSAILHGLLLAAAYDVIRAMRRTFVHGLAAVFAEDLLFWMSAGFLTFLLLFFRTDGVLRGYVAAGIGLGVLLYHAAFGALVLRSLTLAFCTIRNFFVRIRRILRKSVKKTIEFTVKRGYNKIKKFLRGNCHGRKKKTQQE
jgi:spore cortex biosynthesis protein YabQ